MEKYGNNSKYILVILVTTFLFTLSGGIVTLTIPLYAYSIGALYFDIGFIGALYGVVYALSGVPLGIFSDIFGRRKLIIFSILLASICYLLYIFLAKSIESLTFIRALEAVPWVTWWLAIEAFIIDNFRRPGKYIGAMSACYGFSFMLGSILAGYVGDKLGFNINFTSSLVLSIVALAIFTSGIRLKENVYGKEALKYSFNRVRFDVIIPYIVAITYSYILAMVLSIYPVYLNEALRSETFTGLVVGLFWLGRIIAFIYMGALSDRIGRAPVLLTAMILCILSLAAVSFPNVVYLVPGTLVLGLGLGAAYPAAIALISDVISTRSRGLATGTFESIIAIGFTIGSYIGGYLASSINPSVPYIAGIVVAIPCTLILTFKVIKDRFRA